MSTKDVWISMGQSIAALKDERTVRLGSGLTVFSRKGVELGQFDSLPAMLEWFESEGTDDIHWVGGDGSLEFLNRLGSNKNTIWVQVVTIEGASGALTTEVAEHVGIAANADSISTRRAPAFYFVFRGNGELLGISRSLASTVAMVYENDGLGRDLYWIDDTGCCSPRLPITNFS